MASFRSTLLLFCALPLAGCVQGPDYRPVPPSQLGVPESYSVPATEAARADVVRWWTSFDDPVLASLIERGLLSNLDIGQAVFRLVQAREALVQNRAALFPTVSASAGSSRSESLAGGSTTVTLPDGTVTSFSQGGSTSFSLGADASYQVPIFGGTIRSVEAARAQYAAAGFDLATVQRSIEAEIARNYVQLRLIQRQIDNARRSLVLQDDNLEIAGFRVQAGLVSSLDSEQARAQRAQTAAILPSLEASYNAAVSRLAVLLGLPPGALKDELAEQQPIPEGPETVAVGIPAETLRQRPDVLSAERSLAAATAQIGVAQAQLYPALAIGGSITSGADALDAIGDTITGRLFANIAQTIFDAGRTRAQVRSAEAATQAAFLGYRQTILQALEEVETALVALRTAQERERQFRIALEAAENTAILSRSQYRTGLTDFFTLNQAEAQLLSAGNSLAQARADQATALVQLYLAMGAGWDAGVVPVAPEELPPPPPTSQDR